MSDDRHSTAEEASLITNPIEEARRESENAIAQFDRSLDAGSLDLGALEKLLDSHLATQLLSAYDDAKNPDQRGSKDRKLH